MSPVNEAGVPVQSDAIVRCRGTLRTLVIVDILLAILTVTVSALQGPLLPPVLREFERLHVDRLGVQEILLVCVGVPTIILAFIAWVALLRGWRNGRMLYTILWVLSVPLLLLAGPGVHSGLLNVADSASTMVSGMILGLLYFSDIRFLYDRRGSDAAFVTRPG